MSFDSRQAVDVCRCLLQNERMRIHWSASSSSFGRRKSLSSLSSYIDGQDSHHQLKFKNISYGLAVFWVSLVCKRYESTSTHRPEARAQSGWYATRQESFEHWKNVVTINIISTHRWPLTVTKAYTVVWNTTHTHAKWQT